MGASTLSEVATKLSGGNVAAAPAATASVADLERRANAAPRDAQNWLALADAQRAQRDFQGARASLEKVVTLKAMTAQSWADYADNSPL
jgi:cytochrome c-type biogenesis protein CcmH/NrfG